MMSYQDIISWYRIVISYYDIISWHHIMIWYHDIISWYHIMIWYHDIISWCHIMISYHDVISWYYCMIPNPDITSSNLIPCLSKIYHDSTWYKMSWDVTRCQESQAHCRANFKKELRWLVEVQWIWVHSEQNLIKIDLGGSGKFEIWIYDDFTGASSLILN